MHLISIQKLDFFSLCLLRNDKIEGARTVLYLWFPLWLILQQVVQSSFITSLAICIMRFLMSLCNFMRTHEYFEIL